MTYTERIVNVILRAVLRALCRINTNELRRIPRRGPVILMANHTSNIEGPAYYLFIQPRPATALGKQELWENPITRFFMKTWGVIPVARGQVDRSALKAAIRALDEGKLLGIAPEGTRSKSGALRRAQPGIALLATMRRVPVYPVAQWGFHNLGRNLKQIRRTRVTIRLGKPFVVADTEGSRPGSQELREITDEMMYELARALPPRYRGRYADIPETPPRHLTYLE